MREGILIAVLMVVLVATSRANVPGCHHAVSLQAMANAYHYCKDNNGLVAIHISKFDRVALCANGTEFEI